jgi:hypothetical protein
MVPLGIVFVLLGFAVIYLSIRYPFRDDVAPAGVLVVLVIGLCMIAAGAVLLIAQGVG